MKVLVVCYDKRVKEFGKLFSMCEVYWIQKHNYYHWKGSRWSRVTETEVNSMSIDILFFHTGVGDPMHIPTELTVKVEFSFSTDSYPPDVKSRPNAVKILRQFTIGACPFTPEIVKEFVACVDNDCSPEYLPSICRLVIVMEYLPAISILCQGYLAVVAMEVGPGNGSNQIVEDALKQMGWNDEVAALCQYEESNFTDDENNIKKSISWQDVFQTKSVTDVKKEVAMELGIDDLDGSETYMDIAGLINEIEAGHEIEVETVAKAYLCLTHKLEQF